MLRSIGQVSVCNAMRSGCSSIAGSSVSRGSLATAASPHSKLPVIGGFNGASARREKHYFLYYDYVPDILERRAPFREEHIATANALVKSGDLVFGGPQTEPVDSAVFLFETDSSDLIENFVQSDPYYKNGLITGYRIREFNMVVKTEE